MNRLSFFPGGSKMQWKFEKTQDILNFANHIYSELMKQGKTELASEINKFSGTFYTTSSEL
jgi:ribosomal protein S6